MQKNIVILIASIALVAFALGIVIVPKATKMGGPMGSANMMISVTDADFGKAWASTTAGRIFGKNADRQYAIMSFPNHA